MDRGLFEFNYMDHDVDSNWFAHSIRVDLYGDMGKWPMILNAWRLADCLFGNREVRNEYHIW